MTHDIVPVLAELERKVLWLSTWMIHNANHLRANPDGLKVGGHQASSASLATLMTALYFDALRPEDRVAVKPHASPVFHAIQYLLGNQSRENLQNFRAFGGAQSYPSRIKDADDVDFSTGSVGLGVAQTLFASLAQDYIGAKDWARARPDGKMIALVGDAEMDEGNIFEALLEGWKHGLRNTWWVVDYNRQSLDAVVREGLWARFETMFKNFGWDVVVLKYGRLQCQAFEEEGGDRLRDWIDRCPNQLYSALAYQGGAAWRRRLLDELGDQGAVSRLIEARSDAELAQLMCNLGGHDLPSILEAFRHARSHDRPTCFIAYTIKGAGLPLAGHKDNHGGLLTPAQMEGLKVSLAIRDGHEWDRFEGLGLPEQVLQAHLDGVPFKAGGRRRHASARLPVPDALEIDIAPSMSTQQAFGLLMHGIAKSTGPLADRIVTTSPDVTVSTNLGAWVNRRGLFAKESVADLFKSERIPSTYNWTFSPRGQHIELGIAEMNLFILLSALGLSHSLFGERLIPVGTLYDPFIERGLDALNYACYQGARFIVAATPSGLTLAPEGGAHQSISTPLIGLSKPGLRSFEPAYADELAVILRHSIDYIQRDGDEDAGEADGGGGAVYLRLSTRPLDQPRRDIGPALARAMVEGAYWVREPGPNAELVVAYCGAVAPEAINAVGLMAEDRRDVGLLAITSPDALHAGWAAAERARRAGRAGAASYVERLLAAVPRGAAIVTVCDGHPATLGWLGSVQGHRLTALGVTEYGQSGSIQDLYRAYGLDSNAIIAAAETLQPSKPIRFRMAS